MSNVDITVRAINATDAGATGVASSLGKINAASSSLVPGLESARTSVTKFAADNAALIGVVVGVGAALIKAVNDTVAYNTQIHNLSLMSGEGMESSSRLVQVLDDFGVSTSALTPIIKAMTSQGLTPNLETIAKLSDQYIAIQDPVQKNAFLFKTFGKAGDDLALAMSAGSRSILEMGAAVDDSLIATEAGFESTEKYRLALDDLNDTLEGVKMSVGGIVLEPLTAGMQLLTTNVLGTKDSLLDLIVATNPLIYGLNLLKDATDWFSGSTVESTAAVEAHGAALDGDVISTTNLGNATELTGEQIKEMTSANNAHMSLIQKLQGVTDDYNEKLADTTAEYGEGSAEVKQLQADHQAAMNSIIFDLYLAKLAVDGFTDAEFDAALKVGVSLGIIDQSTADTAKGFIELADEMVESGDTGAGAFESAATRMTAAGRRTIGLFDPASKSAIAARDAIHDAAFEADSLAGEYEVTINTTYNSTGTPPVVPPTTTPMDMYDLNSEISDKRMGQMSLIANLQRENDNFKDSMKRMKDMQTELNAEIAEAVVLYGADSEQVKYLQAQYDDTAKSITELQDKHKEAMNSIVFDLYVAKLSADGLTDAEFKLALQSGKTLGLLDQDTIDLALSIDKSTQTAVDGGKALGNYFDAAAASADSANQAMDAMYNTAASAMDVMPNTIMMDGTRTPGTTTPTTMTQTDMSGFDYERFAMIIRDAFEQVRR